MNSNTYCTYPYVDISFRQSTKQNRIKEMLLSSIRMRKKNPTSLLIPKAQCLILFFPPSSNNFIFHFCIWQHWHEILYAKQSWVYHHFWGVFLAFCNTLTPPALPTPASRRSWDDPMPCWTRLCWDQSCFQCEGRWECSGGRGRHLVSGEGAVYPFIFSLLFCLTHV